MIGADARARGYPPGACPQVGWNEGTNWPVGCGHPCLGCAEPDFWDKMTPFYSHVAGVPGFGVHTTADRVGIIAAAGVAGAYVAHGLVQLTRRRAARVKTEAAAAQQAKGGQS